MTQKRALLVMTARTVADIIVREVVTRFGVPTVIHSDQGKQFEGQLFSQMCEVLHIKKTLSDGNVYP